MAKSMVDIDLRKGQLVTVKMAGDKFPMFQKNVVVERVILMELYYAVIYRIDSNG